MGRKFIAPQLKKLKQKKELVEYAKAHNLDFEDHYIDTIGFEFIHGLKVPTALNEYPEFLTNLI